MTTQQQQAIKMAPAFWNLEQIQTVIKPVMINVIVVMTDKKNLMV